MKIYNIIFVFFIAFASFFLVPKHIEAAVCPLPFDTKVNQDPVTGQCRSQSDPLFNPGLNTTGGTLSTCGPGSIVRCPGSPNTIPIGNTCVVQINGSCFAGQGPSGFNTPGCTPSNPTMPLPRCPNPMDLTVKVVDSTGKGINGITITITYAEGPSNPNGQTTTAFTDTTGTAVIKGLLYSGDHFIVIPNSPYYTLSPKQIGTSNNIGDQEMNTLFSCGTALENGTSRPPCLFTAAPNGTPMPNAPATPQFNDPTVNDTLNSVSQTMVALIVIGGIGYGIQYIGGHGGVKSK